MIYRVVVAERALERIEAQARFIASEGGAPLGAARWLSRVLQMVADLERMPRRCPLAPECGYRGLEIRFADVDGYLLLFTIDDDARMVLVLDARHGRQRPPQDGAPEAS